MKRDLIKLFNECKEELDVLDIPYSDKIVAVKENSRFTRCYGRCDRTNGKYTIQIASFILDDSLDDRCCKSVIMHELVHTIDGCFNHGAKFQSYMDLIADCYGLKMGTYVDREYSQKVADAGLAPKRRKQRSYWVIGCNNCGAKWNSKRKNTSVRIINKEVKGYCTCPYCKSHDFYVFKETL